MKNPEKPLNQTTPVGAGNADAPAADPLVAFLEALRTLPLPPSVLLNQPRPVPNDDAEFLAWLRQAAPLTMESWRKTYDAIRSVGRPSPTEAPASTVSQENDRKEEI